MAELVIAFLAGVGFASIVTMAFFAWSKRRHIVDEFKSVSWARVRATHSQRRSESFEAYPSGQADVRGIIGTTATVGKALWADGVGSTSTTSTDTDTWTTSTGEFDYVREYEYEGGGEEADEVDETEDEGIYVSSSEAPPEEASHIEAVLGAIPYEVSDSEGQSEDLHAKADDLYAKALEEALQEAPRAPAPTPFTTLISELPHDDTPRPDPRGHIAAHLRNRRAS